MIGTTTGVPASSLNGAADTITTGRVPYAPTCFSSQQSVSYVDVSRAEAGRMNEGWDVVLSFLPEDSQGLARETGALLRV